MKLSVIISAYNVSQYIEECIASVLNQTYRKLEIIVVNDGSTDNTAELVQKYQTDKRLILVNKKNGGLSEARNTGIHMATGDLITFVDGDDVIASETYSENINFFVVHPTLHMVQFPTYMNWQSERQFLKTSEEQFLTGEEFIFRNWWKNDLLNYSVCNKIFRKNLFDHIKFPAGRTFEDMFILPSLCKVIEQVMISDKGIYYYRFREGSILNSVISYPKYRDQLDARLAIYRNALRFQSLKTERIEFLLDIYWWQLYSLHHYTADEQQNSFYDLKRHPFRFSDIWTSQLIVKKRIRLLVLYILGFENLYFLYRKWKK